MRIRMWNCGAYDIAFSDQFKKKRLHPGWGRQTTQKATTDTTMENHAFATMLFRHAFEPSRGRESGFTPNRSHHHSKWKKFHAMLLIRAALLLNLFPFYLPRTHIDCMHQTGLQQERLRYTMWNNTRKTFLTRCSFLGQHNSGVLRCCNWSPVKQWVRVSYCH